VFLKVSPTKGILRFGMIEKLSPRYIGPDPIIQRVGEVAYGLEMPPELPRVHNIFHVSQLCKYLPDPSYAIEPDLALLQEDLSYEEHPIRILNRREKQLRRNTMPLVKILWENHEVSEATWEPEQEMREKSHICLGYH